MESGQLSTRQPHPQICQLMVTIQVMLTSQTPLNIGSGAQQGTLAKRGMLKDSQGWPYIPASTFKGRLRHAVEQVASTLHLPQTVCQTNQRMCQQDPCVVCQLFGSPWVAGTVRFADLTLSGPAEVLKIREKGKYPHTTQRMGVTLNRRRRVAEDAFLYSTELLYPGIALQFSGSIIGPITQAQAGLLVAGLHLLPALGRGKTGGLGWVTMDITVTADAPPTEWTKEMLSAAVQTAYTPLPEEPL